MKKVSGYIVAAVLIVWGVGIVRADSVAHKFGISGLATAVFPVGDQSVMDNAEDDGQDFGGMLRFGLTPALSFGVSYDNVNLNGQNGERHHPEAILANLLIHLSPDKKWVPTLQAGVGIASTEKKGPFNNTSARGGLGLDYFFTPNFSAGPEVNYTFIANGRDGVDEYHNLGAGIMASLYFGGAEEKAAEAAPAPVAAVAAVPVVVDSDGDGVLDPADRCPGTSSGTPVDANGCPQPKEEKVSLELQVLFDTGKTTVRPEYRAEVKKVADFLSAHPTATGEIQGFTDNVGSADANQRLSQQRADHIREFLIKEFSLDPSRITARGFGEDQPVADNATPEGRLKNRRVMVMFESTKLVPQQ